MSLKVVRVCELIATMENMVPLSELVKRGVLSTVVVNAYGINKRLQEKKNVPKNIIYMDLSEEFNVSESTIYRAEKMMNENLHIYEDKS